MAIPFGDEELRGRDGLAQHRTEGVLEQQAGQVDEVDRGAAGLGRSRERERA